VNFRKLSIATAIVAVCAPIALAGTAGASGGVATTVTIQAQQGGFFGYVMSHDQKCEAGRKVVLFKQTGSAHKPSQDIKIGSDIAQPNGPHSMWSINTNTSGRFYAHVRATVGCQAAFSKTVRSQ
jgi:hypothetical protein